MRTPRIHGFVEHMDRALMDECSRVKGRENWYLSTTGIRQDLEAFMTGCNLERQPS